MFMTVSMGQPFAGEKQDGSDRYGLCIMLMCGLSYLSRWMVLYPLKRTAPGASGRVQGCVCACIF